MKLMCHKCGHIWDYQGRKKEYAICPRKECHYKVNIHKNKII